MVPERKIIDRYKIDKRVKSQNYDGNVKSSSSRHHEFCGTRRTDERRSENQMNRNAAIGRFMSL